MVETSSSGCEDVFACPVWGKTIELNCACPQNLRIQGESFVEAAFTQITAPPLTIIQGGLATDDPHHFHLIHLLEGPGTYFWAGGTVTQRLGDIVIVDTAEISQLVSQVDSRLVRWSFPEALIGPFHRPSRGAREEAGGDEPKGALAGVLDAGQRQGGDCRGGSERTATT